MAAAAAAPARPADQPRARVQAMFVDFGMAQQYGGDCYLRFDDTNPEAEKKEFIEHIQDIVAWLGWRPAKVAARRAPRSPAAHTRRTWRGRGCLRRQSCKGAHDAQPGLV